jgi:hypothetical protein
MPSTSRTLQLALGALVCLGPSGLAAAAAPATKAKIAIMDVRAVGAFDPKIIAGLTAVVAAEAGRREDVLAISGTEINTMLGFEREKQLISCADDNCLTEIGAALGVGLLLSSEVSQVGAKWIFSAVLIDTAKSKVRGRVSREATDATDLVDIARRSTLSLLGTSLGESRVVSVALAAEASVGKTRRIAGFSVIAVGGAALIGSGIAALLAQGRYNDLKDAGSRGDAAAYDAAKGATRSLALATDILLGVGVAAAATGVVLVLTAPRAPEAITLSLTPASVTAAVRF